MIARTSMVAAAFTAVALIAAPALASLGSEVTQGQRVATQLKAGETSCSKLTDSDFEHLGEYVMDRMIGSRAAHRAMNNRMESMTGSQTADRMHEAIGRRFAGCPAGGTGAGSMMGGGIMGSGGMMGSASGWGAMTSSASWSWMRNGNWQHMSKAQWRNAATSMMGGGWMMSGTAGARGWSTGAVVGVVVLALLIGGLIVFVIVRSRQAPGRFTNGRPA